MAEIVSKLNSYVWSPVLIYLCLGVGLYFSIRTRFMQVRGFKEMIRLMFKGEKSPAGVSSFQALAMSLSGRVGTGNIAGVATAITFGGPGAVFWMWMVAFLGASTAYVESTLGQIYKEIDDSLRRLRTDVIDLYQVHWPDPAVQIEETAGAMADLKRAGKIRAIGVSNSSPAQMETFGKVTPLQAAQPPYNLFERGIERDVLPYCRDRNIVTLAYGALCRGLLSGRMTRQTRFSGDDLRNSDPKFQAPSFAQYLEAVERLERFAQENYGKRVIALAVRWILDRQPSTIALWGARRPEQLAPVSELEGWHVGESAMTEIDRILEASIDEPLGPEFMAPPARAAAGCTSTRSRAPRRRRTHGTRCAVSVRWATRRRPWCAWSRRAPLRS